MSGLTILSEIDEQAVTAFCIKLCDYFHENIEEIRLFGSKARGDDDPESDIDILIIVDKSNPETESKIFDLAYDTSLEYDVVIIPLIQSSAEYNNPKTKASLFYHTTQKEGIVI